MSDQAVDAAARSWECFAVSVEDKVAHIRLNRPKAFNSMNRARKCHF